MANKQRYYFIDTHTSIEKLAIVEAGTTTVDGVTSNYQSISEVKNIRFRGSFLDTDLTTTTAGLTGSYANIPSRFHQHIVSKVIAEGYKDPRHMELQTAQYFDMEYEKGIKRAKRFSKSNYQTSGRIVPQDF